MNFNELNQNNIKEFIKYLGCECSDDVFKIIEIQNNIISNNELVIKQKINIGNKLLIYLIEINEFFNQTKELSEIFKIFRNILLKGKIERDNKKFNRFRLVIIINKIGKNDSFKNIKDIKNIINKFQEIFQELQNGKIIDEKIHLHIIEELFNLI